MGAIKGDTRRLDYSSYVRLSGFMFSLAYHPRPELEWPFLRTVQLRSGSMLGILYTFWGLGFLVFMKKGSFFLPGVMWAYWL